MKAPLRVKEVAEKQGYNIHRLQLATGLAYNTCMAYWHSDVRQISWQTLVRIADVLNVQPRDLIADVNMEE